MSDAIISTKLELTGEIFWDSRCCLRRMGICVLRPAHESEMRGDLVYLLIVKYLLILCKFSHSILDWMALSCLIVLFCLFVVVVVVFVVVVVVVVFFGGEFLKHF